MYSRLLPNDLAYKYYTSYIYFREYLLLNYKRRYRKLQLISFYTRLRHQHRSYWPSWEVYLRLESLINDLVYKYKLYSFSKLSIAIKDIDIIQGLCSPALGSAISVTPFDLAGKFICIPDLRQMIWHANTSYVHFRECLLS